MKQILLMMPLLAGCGVFAGRLPDAKPPLAKMEEPLELFQEPDDEQQRQSLPLGSFTGAYVGDARQSLEAMLGESEGLEIERVVENSPADLAGLRTGDILLETRVGDDPSLPLQFPSQWRQLELETPPGTELTVVYDRANVPGQATIELVRRVHPGDRERAERFREEDRVGVVVRTATEVEAREAGLGPGAGAVVVGLSRDSPWRQANIRYGDLLVSIGGREVAHPQVVLEAIRAGEGRIEVVFVRNGERRTVESPLTRRATETREIYIPLLFSHDSERGKSSTSVLLSIFSHEKTAAAWRVRLFWIIRFGGGDADELLEIDR